MSTEDLTTYTEVDPNNRLTVTTSKVTFTNLSRNEDAYLYKDKGVDFFDGDFGHGFAVQLNSAILFGSATLWAVTNGVDDIKGLEDASSSFLELHFYRQGDGQYNLTLYELDGAAQYLTVVLAVNLGVPYYLVIRRNESAGTYGTLYCDRYSDLGRTNLIETMSIALHSSKKDFRYLFACNSYNSASAENTISGWMDNQDLAETTLPPGTYPSDAVARVSSIRHIFRPGLFVMQVGLGDLGFDIDIAESTLRKELNTIKEIEVPPEPVVEEPTITEVPSPTAPAMPELEMRPVTEAYAEAARRQDEPGALTERTLDILARKSKEVALLNELRKIMKAADAPGITGYARQVLIRKAIELREQLETLYRS